MKIIFLGTGSAINTLDTGASILVNENILIDAPGGVTQAIRKFGGDITHLDTIIITHLHGDHFFGLPFLLLEYKLKTKEAPPDIIAPAGARELFTRLAQIAFPGTEEFAGQTKPSYYIAADGKEITINDISVKFHGVPHGDMETYGVEIRETNKRKIFYAPDTSYSDVLVEITAKVDVAVLDATTPDEPIEGHMSMRQVNQLAEKFPGKLFMLTHRGSYPMESSPPPFPGIVMAPAAGDTFVF